MITKELIEFGLGEKEAKTYLALLELEVATVQEIAKTANINRSSAYVTLESLKKRGLVSMTEENNVRKYIATPPETILRAAEDAAHKQEQIRKKIEAIIPNMKALYKGTKKKPIVRVFEGKEGLIAAFEDTLTSREKFMRVYSSPINLGKIIADYLPKFIQKRFELGIKMHGIHPNNEIYQKLNEQGLNKLDSYALIPEKKYDFPADIAIYDDKIGYMSNENDGIAVVIESKQMSDIMKNIFDLAFGEAKRLQGSAKLKKN